MPDITLTPRAAFAGMTATGSYGTGPAGVTAIERDGMGVATVLVSKAQLAALCQRVHERFGIQLPQGPCRVISSGAVAWAGTGPGTWLAMREAGGNAFAADLQETIGDLASVVDQADGYAVLTLTGPKVRDALAKLVPLDLHSRAFRPGDVAATVASHMGVTLWRSEDTRDESAVFEVAIFRSLAGSFWHALRQSAAEFGMSTKPCLDDLAATHDEV